MINTHLLVAVCVGKPSLPCSLKEFLCRKVSQPNDIALLINSHQPSTYRYNISYCRNILIIQAAVSGFHCKSMLQLVRG